MSEMRSTATTPFIATLACLALTSAPPVINCMTSFSMPVQSSSTIENSQTAMRFFPYDFRISSRGQALSLFAKQEYYTSDELKTYKAMLKKKSRNLGLNINDLLKKML